VAVAAETRRTGFDVRRLPEFDALQVSSIRQLLSAAATELPVRVKVQHNRA